MDARPFNEVLAPQSSSQLGAFQYCLERSLPGCLQGGWVHDANAGGPLPSIAFGSPKLLLQRGRLLVKLDALRMANPLDTLFIA